MSAPHGSLWLNLSFMTVSVPSFAKINLGLRIGAPRPDGFHELRTVYQTIALHDAITVSVGRGSGIEIDAKIHASRATRPIPAGKSSNARCRRSKRADACNQIEKRLPVQGGLGGASGNAVAALLALERALKKRLPAARKIADRRRSWLRHSSVPDWWHRAGRRPRRGSLSFTGSAGDAVRDCPARDCGFDSKSVRRVG